MNFGSGDQLRMVAGSCKHFTNKGVDVSDRDITCGVCQNWDGSKCMIGVYDKVLTSLDQT